MITALDSYEELDMFLESKGWTLECFMPLSIYHKETQTRIGGPAAELMIKQLRKEDKKNENF